MQARQMRANQMTRRVADVLGPEAEVTDGNNNDTGTNGRSESPPDTNMGGLLGESGGTLAPKAGERSADGKTNLRSGPPISDELARAIAGRIVGTIRNGVKQFEVIIRDLRVNFTVDLVTCLKPRLIRTWNALREKYGLDEATEIASDAAMSDTAGVQIEQTAAAFIQNTRP